MEIYTIKNLSFRYPQSEYKALHSVNLSIEQGEFICLCGKSGCGKTTLLRLLKSALSPHGEQKGEIYFNNKSICEYNSVEQASKIGFVMQDIESQIVTDKVWHELAFGLESLGVDTNKIRSKVAEISEFFGITDWFHKNVSDLSGGQKQLLNLASVMVMNPDVIILDEPTSQLDPIAANEFIKTIEKINRELGITIILSEHRLEEVFPISDRVVMMDNGEIISDGSPQAVGKSLSDISHDMCDALPTPMRVALSILEDKTPPLTIREGRNWLSEYSKNHSINKYEDKSTTIIKNTCLEVKEVWFRYEKNEPDTIKGMSLKINKGEIFSVVGGNGAGKSTMLSLISGINKPYRGRIRTFGKVMQLPQNPQAVFTKKSILDELRDMSDNEKKINEIIAFCELENILQRHPSDLSGGEVQRVALAKVLITEPEILLLDEPTKGLDAHFKGKLEQMLRSLSDSGMSIIMVTHDIEFCARVSDRCSMFFDGSIISTAIPREMFSENNFYTTSASRMARHIMPWAITAEDIVKGFTE